MRDDGAGIGHSDGNDTRRAAISAEGTAAARCEKPEVRPAVAATAADGLREDALRVVAPGGDRGVVGDLNDAAIAAIAAAATGG